MSRAFVNEDNQEEAPIIPERAPLPPNVTNYVTSVGLKLLITEKELLEKEKSDTSKIESDKDKRRLRTLINGKLSLLEERINSAQVMNTDDMPSDEVRFGAIVEIDMNGKKVKLQIVGVDEADARKGKIAFTAPIAKAITGKKVGEKTILSLGNEQRPIEILIINY